MINPIAGPLTNDKARAESGAPSENVDGAPPPGGTLNAGANSGICPKATQAVEPSACTWVCALARPSLIHCRSVAAEIGPYSLPSPPSILYIRFVYVNTVDLATEALIFAPDCVRFFPWIGLANCVPVRPGASRGPPEPTPSPFARGEREEASRLKHGLAACGTPRIAGASGNVRAMGYCFMAPRPAAAN